MRSQRSRVIAVLLTVLGGCHAGSPKASPPAPEQRAAALNRNAQSLRAEGRRREAIEAWTRALEIAPDDNNVRIELAGALISEHRMVEARVHLDILAQDAAEEPRVWLEWGRLHLHLEEPEEALEAFSHARGLDPSLLSVQLGRIEAMIALGRCDDARAALLEVPRRGGKLALPRVRALLARCEAPASPDSE